MVTKHTDFYGVSVDMDAFDPGHIPGVGLPVKNGIDLNDFFDAIKDLR